MKTRVFGAVLVALLAGGCATQEQAEMAKYQKVYDKPLTSPGAKFGALPPLVQRTVLAEAGQAEVVDAVRDTSSGKVVYKIYFRASDIFPPLYVAPDGSVLNPDLTVAISAVHGERVKPEDVPEAVKKAIKELSHGAEVDYVNQEAWGGKTVYVVTFKDAAHNPKLLLDENGKAVKETDY